MPPPPKPAYVSRMVSTQLPVSLLLEKDRLDAIETIRRNHYTHSVSAGKTHYFQYDAAIISFSIPANKNIAKFLLGRQGVVWEFSRMWAPDNHAPNLLTQAISACIKDLLLVEPEIEALVSYADPNVKHTGGVYKAASWVNTGPCEESRYYRGPKGEIVARRKFHSGKHVLRKAEIEALGYAEFKCPGKIRFVKGLTKRTRKEIYLRFLLTTQKEPANVTACSSVM